MGTRPVVQSVRYVFLPVLIFEHCDAMKWRCYQMQTTALSSADFQPDVRQFYADAQYAEAEC